MRVWLLVLLLALTPVQAEEADASPETSRYLALRAADGALARPLLRDGRFAGVAMMATRTPDGGSGPTLARSTTSALVPLGT